MGDEVVILPDEIKPGDVIECHGVKQRVTYEFGAYGLVKADHWGVRRGGQGPATSRPGFDHDPPGCQPKG